MKSTLLFLTVLIFPMLIFSQEVELELFATGFNSPLALQHTGMDDDSRLFVVEQGGMIKIVLTDGSVNPSPFLDISNLVSSGGERGLLGLAFHPDYENNGCFYVNYTDTDGNTQVSRFSVDGSNPDIANANSELPIIAIEQPFSNHNGGCLAFGPEGYLFIASGDGGSGGDPGNRAQDLSVLLGKLLRIDVDNPSEGKNYGIPADNPFVNDSNALGEIWAYGLRNPWRFSFDTVGGHIWIGDVGQGNIEEIDRSPISTGGLNYGWRCYEGSQVFNAEGCPPDNELVFPFAAYSSASGSGNCSVTGGFVYRGSVYPNIQGLYFFADYCSGMIGSVDNAGNIMEYGEFPGSWVSFGEDGDGELYIVDIDGSIYKLKGNNLSVTDNRHTNKISMFPNPASKELVLKAGSGEITSISVFDLSGKKVFFENNISTTQRIISVSNLTNGVYFVKIEMANQMKVFKKLMVE